MKDVSLVLRKNLAASTDETDDDGDGAEAEGHERAESRRERVDGEVRERVDQVEVADHRPRARTGWEPVLAGGAGAALAAEGGDDEKSGGEHDAAQERE